MSREQLTPPKIDQALALFSKRLVAELSQQDVFHGKFIVMKRDEGLNAISSPIFF